MISLEQHQLRRIKISCDSLKMPQEDQQTSTYWYGHGSSVQCLGLLEIIQGNHSGLQESPCVQQQARAS